MTVPRTATAPTLEQQVAALTKRVTLLEAERPGRKSKPLLVMKQRGVCAIDPNRDSSECPDASIYRYQSGCHGDNCRLKQHEAYERRKVNGAPEPALTIKSRRRTAKKVEKPATKTTKATKAPVTKRVSKRAS